MGRQAKLRKLRKQRVVSFRGAEAQQAFEAFCDLTEDDFNEDSSLKPGAYNPFQSIRNRQLKA